MANRPNVVLLVLDTVRRDRLSTYGYSRETMPVVDEFAAEATVFEDAISQASWSIPAHASLFTGLYPSAHGAVTTTPVLRARRPLAEQLQRAGYETYAVSPNEYVRPSTGFGRGFDEFDTCSRLSVPESLVSAYAPIVNRATASSRVRRPLELGFNRVRQCGGETGTVPPQKYGTADRVETALKNASEPFFLFINLPHAHLPRSPEPDYREQFVDGSLPVESVVRNERTHSLGEQPMDEETTTAMSQLYDADLRTLDDRVQDVFSVLSTTDCLEDALVILTADHGEHLGEWGLVGHQHSVFSPVTDVPLVIDFPENSTARVESQVETRRIYHTVLDVTGVRPYPELSLASGTGDAVARGSFHSPMLDLAALLEGGRVEYDPQFLGEPLSFRRESGHRVVTFADMRWELPEGGPLKG